MRRRVLAVFLLVVPLGLGLWVLRQNQIGGVVATYGGDVLWPVPFWCVARLLVPQAGAGRRLAAVALVTVGIEVSQLADWHWLAAARRVPALSFLLGNAFLISDLACIALGVGLCGLLEAWTRPQPAMAWSIGGTTRSAERYSRAKS